MNDPILYRPPTPLDQEVWQSEILPVDTGEARMHAQQRRAHEEAAYKRYARSQRWQNVGLGLFVVMTGLGALAVALSILRYAGALLSATRL